MKFPYQQTLVFAASFLPCLACASIVSVVEENLGNDTPAIIEPTGEMADGVAFGEDVLAYNDRAHQHNGAVFNEETGLPDKESTVIAELPTYLVGAEYIRFANDARDNEGYSATITTDVPSHFYLLLDNRLDGLKGDAGSPNTSDPVLGGALQWVLDAPWARVNTGVSPQGLPDYLGLDESGNGAGAGLGINQFYAVYRFARATTSVVVKNQGYDGGSMVSVVVVPAEDVPIEPISLFAESRATVSFGESLSLRWQIDPAATAATVEPGVGDVLERTNAEGFASVDVQPTVDTEYTLRVDSPSGVASSKVAVSVGLLDRFAASSALVKQGSAVELSWEGRPDVQVSIEPGVGDVSDRIAADGSGKISVVPDADTTYRITATGSGRVETREVAVGLTAAEGNSKRFALIDIGALDGEVEPGAAGGVLVGGGNAGVNGPAAANVVVSSDGGEEFFVSVDTIAADGSSVGRADWRSRGGTANAPLAALARDFVKNNNGLLRVTLTGLPAGVYQTTSYHIDPDFSQAEAIRISVTDNRGVNQPVEAIGSAFFEEGTVPTVGGLTTEIVEAHGARFAIASNGSDPVIVYFNSIAAVDKEVPLAGLLLETESKEEEDVTFALLDIGAAGGQAEGGATGGQLGGGASGENGPVLESTLLTSASNREFSVSIDALDPTGAVVGRIDWRDRGDSSAVPLGMLAEDFLKNNNGMVRVTLVGLPAATYQVTSFHIDPDFSQCEAIKILVTDATGTAKDTGVVGSAFFDGGSIPTVAGLTTEIVQQHSATFPIVANATDNVIIYFDGTAAVDKEVPLSGLELRSSQVSNVTPILSFLSVPAVISHGEEISLRWRIDPKATSASIEPGVGNILDKTDADGSGSLTLIPGVDTTYVLAVEAPSGSGEATSEVEVNLVSDFLTDSTFLRAGQSASLNWSVRPDASVQITPGFGNVDQLTDENGAGTLVVSPSRTTAYTIIVTAGGRESRSTITISVEPQGTLFALLDIGPTDGDVEADATIDQQIGAGLSSENGVVMTTPIDVISETNDVFSVLIDNLNPNGEAVGGLDWRDRGTPEDLPLNYLAEDFVKNSLGMIRVVLSGLPAGDYNLASYHLDVDFSQSEAIRILVTDANGIARDAGVKGDASFEGDAPHAGGLMTEIVEQHSTAFTVASNGSDPIIIYFDGTTAFDDEVPLNGLLILRDSAVTRVEITDFVRMEGGDLALSWQSTPGQFFELQRSLDLTPISWATVVEGIPAAADGALETQWMIDRVESEEAEFFRVKLGRAPDALSEDFEGDAAGWTFGEIEGIPATATSWELGTPSNGPGMAHSGTGAFGTDLDADYTDGTGIYLRSPAVDTGGVRNLRLEFWYYLASVPGEGGRVNVLEEDGSLIQNLEPVFDGATSNTQEWTLATYRLPNLEPSRPFIIEFQLLSAPDDDPANGAGFFIDDVRVSK